MYLQHLIQVGVFLLVPCILEFSSAHWSRSLHLDHFHSLHLQHKHIFDVGPTKDIWRRRDSSEDDDDISWDGSSVSKSVPRDIRLPLEVIPFHYFLEIIPILDEGSSLGKQWTAPGNVKILVEAVKPSSTITLHALFLNISDVQVINRSTGGNISVQSHKYSEKHENQYVITMDKELIVGENYEIWLTFVAPIALHRPDGLYRSQYYDPVSKNITYLVSTQFEFFHARQVFPCFDEPGVKSTFDIAIGRNRKYKSLSNSNLVSSVPLLGEFGWFIDSFNTTVKMPAYLVAFLVSDYKYTEADSTILKNRPVRVYGPAHLIRQGAGDFGANVSARVLSFYEDYFDSEYPMPKMDSVAVPGFLHGAMENYGLNIYREILLFDIPGVTTEAQRSRVSSVIAHENAHQYFGNLVTCKWWDNVYLNEGFATYYSYIGQNATNPEYEPMKSLLIEGVQYAFLLDSRERTSYPLLLTAKSENDLEDQATGLPYYKGASLIRMMNGFLTPETFHKGIKKYLSKWAYEAAEQDNLFETLTEQAHADKTLPNTVTVKEIMDPWTKQRGYPLVRVISSDNDTVYILYEKFQSPSLLREEKHSSWPIPISVATQDDPNFQNHTPKFWIPEGTVVRTLKHDVSRWIVVNPEATGFYRVMYDRKLTRLLQNQLNTDHEVISPFSRSQILDDYFTLGNQMDIPIRMALEFTKYFADETEEISWIVFMKNLKRLYFFYSETENNKLRDLKSSPSSHFKGFRDYMIPRLDGVLNKIGVEQLPNERGSKVTFRSRLLNWSCRLGSPVCMTYAHKLFELWKTNPNVNPIPVDLKDFMMCYGVAAGGVANWLFAFERYVNETSVREGQLLARSLGCVKDEAILKSILESIIVEKDGEVFDLVGVQLLFSGIISNPIGRPVMIKFMKTHMKKLKQHFNTSSTPIIIGLFRELSTYLHTEAELIEIQNIIELHSHTLKRLRPIINPYILDISENINWMSKHYEPMQIWFENQTRNVNRKKQEEEVNSNSVYY